MARAPRARRPPVILGAASIVVALAVVVPLVYLAIRAGDGGWEAFRATLWRRRTLDLTIGSLTLTASVTAICVVVGVAAAWLVARTNLAGRGVWRIVFALPLAVPSYVAAWSWIVFKPDLAGRPGATLVLASISFPYVYLPVLAALQRTDGALDEVAASLGRSPFGVFRSVTLREIGVAASGGALLVALYTMSEFGAVSIMRYESLTQTIYRSYRASFDRRPPAVLGCLLVAIMLVPVILAARVARRSPVAKVGSGVVRTRRRVDLGKAQVPIQLLLVAVMGITFGVPAWNLLRWVERGRSVVDWSELASAFGTTLWVAGLAAAATVAVAIPLGILLARHPGPLSTSLSTAAYVSHALPGIVVALSLVFFGIRFATPLYQRTPMLIAAYVVLFLSLAIAAIHNSIAQAPPGLEDVASSLGRSQLGVWRTVTLRLAAPGVAAGALLVFIAVAKELPATLLLRPIEMDTLATRLWTHTDAASYAAAAPYAAAIVAVATVPTALLTWSRLGGGR